MASLRAEGRRRLRYRLPPFQAAKPSSRYALAFIPSAYPRLTLLTQPPGHPRLQRPQLDEAGRGGLGEEAAGPREGGERGVIDGVGRGACDDAGMALVELQPDRPRDALVDTVHVGVEVVAQRLPPQARVDEV